MSQADENPLAITQALINKFGVAGYSQILVYGLELYNRRVAEIQHDLYDADGEFATIVARLLSAERSVHSFTLETDGTTLVLTVVGETDIEVAARLRSDFDAILERLAGLKQACPEIRLEIATHAAPPS